MQISALFVTAFLIGLSGAMMPGPLLTATIVTSVRRGFWAGPQIVLGHAVLELLLILALLEGFSVFLSQSGVTLAIGLIGGFFLIYLGLTMLKDVIYGRINLVKLEGDQSRASSMHPVLAGIVISISNPFWSIWWATIGLSYLTMALSAGWTGVISFFAGHILADLGWYSLIAIIIAGGRNFLSQRIYNTIIFICGLFLIGLGAYFIV